MTAIEAGVIIAVALSTASSIFRGASDKWTLGLLGLAGCLVILQLAVSYFRWQLIPAYLVLLVLVILALSSVQPAGAGKYVLIVVSILLLALSGLLSAGLPIVSLPAPDGRYAVGTVDLSLKRPVGSEGGGTRRLFVKLWYPADRNADLARYERDTLWSEFGRPDNFPGLIRFFARYLRNMKTHSHKGAPISREADPKVLIYNHSLVSIASDNTLLMEALASRGYVVASVRHKDQNAEVASLNQSVSAEARASDQALMRRLSQKIDPKERAELSLKLFENSPVATTLVRHRTADSAYVLDNLSKILASIPGCPEGACADREHIGAVGFSIGGAIATELSKSDQRCRVVVNLDGGLYGDRFREPITVPYLMLYSELGPGTNDFAKASATAAFEEEAIVGATHLSFHDAVLVLPIMRWVGGLGAIDGMEMISRKNRLVADFLDRHLQSH